MVATEDPTSGSHLSEILASELPEVCCCWRRRSPAASHFTSRASSCQSQAAFRVWRPSDCDPSADRRISSLLWVRRTDTVLRGPRQPADRRELGRGSAALALGWEGLRQRSGTVSCDRLRGQPELCFQKDPETPSSKSRRLLKGRAQGGTSGMERFSFHLDCSPTWACRQGGGTPAPLRLSADPAAPRAGTSWSRPPLFPCRLLKRKWK